MKTMVWKEWTNEKKVPLNTLLLMEVDGDYQTGIFRKIPKGRLKGRVGIVGGQFHFYCKIKRWMIIDPEILDDIS